MSDPNQGERGRTTPQTRREFLKKTFAAGATSSLAAGRKEQLQVSRQESRTRVRFAWRGHTVANLQDGYMVAVADVNSDGRPDILALSSEENIVARYENPSWRARMITTATQKNIAIAPLYERYYPAQGAAIASGFSLDPKEEGGRIWWAEARCTPDAEWSLDLIGQIHAAHRLRWADLDGEGRLELVVAPIVGPGAHSPDYAVGAPLSWLRMPDALLEGHASAEENVSADWPAHLIDDSLTVIHGLLVFDWNGDGRDELLTASFEGVHLFESSGRAPDLRWKKTHLASGDQASRPRRGSSEIGVGTVKGRRFLATIEPWHGELVVVYTEPPHASAAKLWTRHVIDSSFKNGHALACADLDGDGNDEIVAGYRGPGTSLYIYKALDSSAQRWERQTLDSDIAASSVVIKDLNGDGRPDIVAIGSTTANVKWYENLS